MFSQRFYAMLSPLFSVKKKVEGEHAQACYYSVDLRQATTGAEWYAIDCGMNQTIKNKYLL